MYLFNIYSFSGISYRRSVQQEISISVSVKVCGV